MTKDNFDQWDGPQTLLRCLPEFLLGTLLYSAFRSSVCVTILSKDVVALVLLTVIVLLLHVGAPDLAVVPLFAVMILAAVANTGAVAAALNARPLVWLGEVSYSLYLIHNFVQFVTTKLLTQGFEIGDRKALSQGRSLALMVGMVVVCLLLAGFAHRHIEVAGRRYLRRALD